ncbi:MAG: xanthine dehydrogenase family protein molybdopterin-binding subunit [Alphaproteobacteria bacterium]|nr:xanthine dehydrogenase family protein molybdopterin-binding subunit [Alphaproteobacteria bacterium]
MTKFGIGQAVRRTEDLQLLTGAGQYTADVDWPQQTYAVAVRSPYAHAHILSMDTADAEAAPGVLAVITGEQMRADGVGPMASNIIVTQPDGSKMVDPPRYALAEGKVRHVGDPVAFVVAETLDQARDAAELVMVDYDDLPAVTDTDLADADGAPLVYDEAPNNRCFTWEYGDEATADDGMAKAAHTVRLKLINNRIVVNSMEPRAALAAYEGDAETGRYVLHTPTQGVHSVQRQLAQDVFGVDNSRMRILTGHVGGGFGMKIFLYPEQVCALYAARKLGRPVKWVAERSYDGFTTDKQGRDHVSDIELGLDSDYRITGLKITLKAAMGAYISGFQAFIPTMASAKMYSGVYAIPAVFLRVHGLFTNTTPVDAYRGAGRPEAAYLLERLMDKAALDLGIDPVELRMRNYIRPDQMPFPTSTGPTYDSGDFPRLTRIALERADRDGFEARRAEAEARGKLRGMGMAYYIECCGAGPGEQADIRVDDAGRVTLYIGTQDNGQGHQTAYKQIVSDRLGLDLDRITVVQGDTDLVERGGGTGGSRSIPEGGVAVRNAADGVVDKGKIIAAGILEAAPGDIDFADGQFTIVGTDRQVGFEEVARAAHDPSRLPPDTEPGLDVKVRHKAEVQTYPNGCHVCELEIDPDTGDLEIVNYVVVDDFGTVVNPLMLAGQVHGGIGQGLGQSLLEETVYDKETGQLLSGSFMDYCMPRADDIPTIDFSYVDDIPCTTNPLGIKGAGEAGAIGAPPASINAIVDALKNLGIHHIDMPATKHKIWATIQAARERQAAE